MNTLSKVQTGEFFETAAGYETLRQKWSAIVNDRSEKLGAEHHLLYLALRGKDWRPAFTPISNARKLENGAFYDWALHRALRRIHNDAYAEDLLRPFGDAIDADALAKVQQVLPKSVNNFEIATAYEVTDAG